MRAVPTDTKIANSTFQRSKCGTFGDVVIILLLLAIGGLIEYHILLSVRKQEIPSDSSLYGHPDTTDTVPVVIMMFCAVMSWYTLFIFDLAFFYCSDTSFSIHKWLKHLYLMSRMLFFSLGLSLTTTNIIKYVIGAQRPYFLTAMDEFANGLIDEDELDEARLSFVSGHSSHSMSGLFLLSLMMYSAYKYSQSVYYNQLGEVSMRNCDNPHDYYLSWFWYALREAPLLSMIIVAIPTMVSIFVGLTRIIDYKHFRVDVVSGWLLGGICAAISYSIFCNETYFVIDALLKKKCDALEMIQYYDASSAKENAETEDL